LTAFSLHSLPHIPICEHGAARVFEIILNVHLFSITDSANQKESTLLLVLVLSVK